MKFGVREICDVTFKAKSNVKIGNTAFKAGQPVLFIDTAKTSTIEGAATTVYATGGRGNTRLITWEGEKTLTFTVEDALLSPIGFSVLSGAGLFKGAATELVHFHTTSNGYADANGAVDLTDALKTSEAICETAPIFAVAAESDFSITGNLLTATVAEGGKSLTVVDADGEAYVGPVFVDYYITKSAAKVSELQIDAKNFAGYYYVEASTFFRTQADGVDLPAQITIPNVKIQSNFTFSMASTGDPSTFTFTMDAMPGYTYFNPKKQVLMAIQIIEDDEIDGEDAGESVFMHTEGEVIEEAKADSTPVTEGE